MDTWDFPENHHTQIKCPGSNKKIVEMNVYKFFLDMAECIFMDGKCMIEFILNKKKKTWFNSPIPDTVSISLGRI